jgi:small GTP-binding protein
MKIIQAKVCLLGDFGVGKTSLVRRFVEGRFEDRYLSTIGVKISRKVIDRSDHQLSLLIWDLAGGESFERYEASYLRGVSGALVVCDLTRRDTLKYIHHYADQLRQTNPSTALVFAANKVDLVDECEIKPEDLHSLSDTLRAPYLLTSARTGEQVEAAFTLLADLIETKPAPSPSG